MELNVFAICPPEMFDGSLTKREMQVLGVLFLHRNKLGNTAFPSRATIARHTGVRETTISLVTSALVKKGWLTKKQSKFDGPMIYAMSIPNGGTRNEYPSIPNGGTQNEYGGVPELSTLTDQLTEDKPKHIPAKKKSAVVEVPVEVSLDDWAFFEQHRKEIKKPLTDLARTRLFKLLAEHPKNIQSQMIDKSIENGWAGIFTLKGNSGKPSTPTGTTGKMGRALASLEKHNANTEANLATATHPHVGSKPGLLALC